jgi:hypothetical protein
VGRHQPPQHHHDHHPQRGHRGSPCLARPSHRSVDLQPTGTPYNAIANTPPLAPGAAATVVLYLPYWVFNPDATLEVTADYKDYFVECHEDNNTKNFSGVG